MKPQQIVLGTSIAAIVVCGVAALSLVVDIPVLRHLMLTVPTPMPATITLTLLGTVGLATTYLPSRWPSLFFSNAVWLGAVGVLLLYVNEDSEVARWVARGLLREHIPSPHSAVTLSILGLGITLTATRRRVAARVGHALALIALAATSLVVLAYLFRAREIYSVESGVGISPLMAEAIMLLSFGVLSVTPRFSLVGIFYLPSAGGRMARRFVPFVFGVPVAAAAAISAGFRRGWFTAEAGMALLAVCVMVVLGGVTWRYALGVNIAEGRLERLVRSRTRRLTETITELEEFAQALAHDVRGPLINLREFLRIIRDEQTNMLTSQGRDYLERAIRASERLDRLTSAMLRYGEMSRRPFRLQAVDLEKVVNEVAEEVRKSTIPGPHIETKGRFAEAWADEAGLAEVLRELMRNACRFTRPGVPPVITITSVEMSATVRLMVADEGTGVKPQFHERIFHPFQQLARATEHTGIGLALVRRAIMKMNGRVGVISDGSQGSTFWVELPRPHSRGAMLL